MNVQSNLIIRSLAISLVAIILIRCGPVNKEMKEISESVAEVNAKCPQMIDSETRIDGVFMNGSDTVVYRYTLVNLDANNVDTSQFRILLWPGLLSNVKINRDMKKLRENNVSLFYDYFDKTGKPVYLFKIKPKDYNQ